jgi:virulence factor Mce-like protein
MRRGRSTVSIVASPVLVGSVTLLIACVAVLLAVKANQGLPFVPTYDVKAELPGGLNLVKGNEVRVGGFHVGLVREINPKVDRESGRTIAVIDMALSKDLEPLPKDTQVNIRPRSALGLKYVELNLGRSNETYRAGETIPLSRSTRPVEIDEFFSMNDDETRENQRGALKGFGDALAGRGQSINSVIEDFRPFMTHLEPVMRVLSDRDTRLGEFFRQAGRTSAQIAPVARNYAQLFGNMATTFEALGRDENALQQTIERGPPALDAGIRSFPVQRPFLEHSEVLADKLEPAARQMSVSLPPTTRALEVGTPVVERAPKLYNNTEKVFRGLKDLVDEPTTLLALRDLKTTLMVAAPLLEYIAPYQTVCNYWVYYWSGLSEHVSEPTRGGTGQRSILKSDNRTQDNRISSSEADRPVDVPANVKARGAKNAANEPLESLHRVSYGPAIDAAGNADCQTGQRGYMEGPFSTGNRYKPSNDETKGGGSHVVLDSNFPGLSGPTYKGVPRLQDVP